MVDLPTFLVAALAGLGGFTAWLLKDYIAYLKAQSQSWQQIAMHGVNVVEKAVDRAT